jgi:hypothetical protein
MNISPFLTVTINCNQTLSWVNQQLARAGLRTVQTFDLHDARSSLHNCQCPNHGTEQCDCQMVVLLVYGAMEEPVTLILHGNDGKTWLSVSEGVGTDTRLAGQVRLALDVKETVSTQVSG